MLTNNEIEKRISDISSQLNIQDVYTSTVISGKIDILNWCLNRTEEELYNKIDRIQEEMICLKETNLWYREKAARINEVKFCLQIL